MKLFKNLIETNTEEKEPYSDTAITRKHLEAHFRDISKDHPETKAISNYIGSSKSLNYSLIDGQLPAQDDLETHRAIHKNARPIGAHLSVYTGSGIDLEDAAKQSKDGVIHLPAHTSTSIVKTIASSFGYHKNRINIKPDDKGLYVDHISSMGERELILPAKTRLKYHGRDEHDTPVFSVHSQENPEMFSNPKKAVSDSVINLTGARTNYIQHHIRKLQNNEHYTPQMNDFLLSHFSHVDTNHERTDAPLTQLLNTGHSTTPEGIDTIKSFAKTATAPRLLQHVMRHIPTTHSEYSDLLGRIDKRRFDHEHLLPKETVPMSSKHMHAFIDHFGDSINSASVDNMTDRHDFSTDHIKKIAKGRPAALARLASNAVTSPGSVFNKLEPEEKDKIHGDIISSGDPLGRHLAESLLSDHSWKPSNEMTSSIIKQYPRAFFKTSIDAHKHIDTHIENINALEGYLSNPNKRHSLVDLYKKAKTHDCRQEVARNMNSDDRDEAFKHPLLTHQEKESLLHFEHPSKWSKDAIDHVVLKSENKDLTHTLLQSVSGGSKLERHHIDHILKTGNKQIFKSLYVNEGVNLTDEHRIAAIAHGCNQDVLDRHSDKEGGHPLNIDHAIRKNTYVDHVLAARQPRINRDQLEELSKSKWDIVRMRAAANHTASPDQVTSWLKRAKDDRWGSKEILSISEKQKLTPEHVDIINNHPIADFTTKYALTRNRNAKMNTGQVEGFLRHTSQDLVYSTLERPEIKPKHISEVLSSNAYPTYAKELAAQHQNASDQNISEALKHPHRHVRSAALHNPNVRIHHLQAASSDTDTEVSNAAKRKLMVAK